LPGLTFGASLRRRLVPKKYAAMSAIQTVVMNASRVPARVPQLHQRETPEEHDPAGAEHERRRCAGRRTSSGAPTTQAARSVDGASPSS
jgi:hypothetical protein